MHLRDQRALIERYAENLRALSRSAGRTDPTG